MVLWRISNYSALDGLGGLKVSGRWHTRGHRIVYLSATPASALLEILVHLEIAPGDFPRYYKLLEIHVPDSVRVDTIDRLERLPSNWKSQLSLTRKMGNRWLNHGASALLSVPSALTPHTRNFLLNPLHADASRIVIASVSRQPFDKRLFE